MERLFYWDIPIHLTNTLTRRKERFQPMHEDRIRMFTCGPSIYDIPHVGNYRTFLYEDLLKRYLVHRGFQVHHVINYTDIEDKAVDRAKEEGKRLYELTEPNMDRFVDMCRVLRISLPPFIARSSTSVPQAVGLIRKLVDRGLAYWHEGDVFYDPLKFEGFGKLYGLDMSQWPSERRRFRKDTYPGEQWNLGDFIVWHGARQDEGVEKGYCWKTDIGYGRPAWNVQDAAMITKHLGYKVDISCGGVDNLYRHHDYNIAIIEGLSGETYARCWLHGEHVLLDGKKMSKSKGNVVYPEDLIQRGYTPRQIRFFLCRKHYREKLDMNDKSLDDACSKLSSLRRTARSVCRSDPAVKDSASGIEAAIEAMARGFEERMSDDLDVEGAVSHLQSSLDSLEKAKSAGSLGHRDADRIRQVLTDVDSVLAVIDL